MRPVEERYLSVRSRGRSPEQVQMVAMGRDDRELFRFIENQEHEALEEGLKESVWD